VGDSRERGMSRLGGYRSLKEKRPRLGLFGKPEELADAIVFLCSERASYITGVSLNLDGGRLKSLWLGVRSCWFIATGVC